MKIETPWDSVYINARLATMRETGRETGAPYGAIEPGAIAVADGRIAWLGTMAELPANPGDAPLWRETIDVGGRWITPGLIDCHTHLVHAGNRAREFEMRLTGVSYEDIAKAGGGIVSTVKATRAASEDELVAQTLPRLDALIAEGVTTIEIKSGYGLERDSELRMLRAARRLATLRDVTIKTTFLAAHALPPEYAGRADDYIDLVCLDILPAAYAEGLVDAVDAFCERIGFTTEQCQRVFEAAQALGLPIKLHAEQLSDMKGSVMAAGFSALSCDHLEYIGQDGIDAMAKAGTVAVILPGAFYFLREKTLPPVDAFRKAGVPIALATDCNPGSSPTTSLLLMLNMGATLFRMTPEECLAGVTRNAARALGIGDTQGTLAIGNRADLAIWSIEHPAELSYRIGFNPLWKRVRSG
ncbi:MAG: imidazolonepropionase [Dongiaceae bacterium]